MAAHVEVIEGPDKGWRFTVSGAGVRIGGGPSHAIRLSDPAWSEGSVGIEPHPGGYLVTNNLPHPVFLDAKPLPPGETRTLHHGATLQPTPETLLRLGIVASPPGAEGVLREAPPERKRGYFSRIWPWLFLIAALSLHASSILRSSPPVDVVAASRLKNALTRIEEKQELTVAMKAELRFVRITLTDAVYHDDSGRHADSASGYRDVRDALNRISRMRDVATKHSNTTGAEVTQEERETFDALESFVSNRLKATSQDTKGYSVSW